MQWIDNKSILTPTSGFLKTGFTHTVNLYSGCSFANSLCGVFCYAQHNQWITHGRPWELYGAKRNITEAYQNAYSRARNTGALLSIYMSSSTDPYVPQEKKLELTRNLLKLMLRFSPDTLVIQTHSILIERDLELIGELSKKINLWVSITVETDMEFMPGMPRFAFSPSSRIAVLNKFTEAGIKTQATVAPLLPLNDVTSFATILGGSCTRVILDHYLLGDGSPNGFRTRSIPLEKILIENGFAEWLTLSKFKNIYQNFVEILGQSHVLMSMEGFNAV